MTSWADKFFVYQINTWVWLDTLSRRYATKITLRNVPDEVLDEIAQPGLDMVWLMGVWKRSKWGRDHALKYKHQYEPALPDIKDDDVIGSAYAIGDYVVDPKIGGRSGLAELRKRLRQRGLLLMLDFVPNHVGVDHPWVTEHPDYIVQGKRADLKARPEDFFLQDLPNGKQIVLAHGRDPMFPGWIDTAQLNVFNADLRKAAAETMLDIAKQCDGVRCDMAMLLMNDIFAGTWNGFVGEKPETEYWREIIPQVKAKYPDFMFTAEVYWDKEYDILQLGFDYAYDKTLYDRIMEGDAQRIRQHLVAGIEYQKHMMRFVENHDEPRAYGILGEERSYAVATLICTLPGAVLLHDGQFIGRTVKLPVQIKRQPDETPNHNLASYYLKLLEEARDPIFQHGDWYLFETHPLSPGNGSYKNLLAYGWYEKGKDYRLIVINMSSSPSQGRVNLSAWSWLAGNEWRLTDVTDGTDYQRQGGVMTEEGLTILLDGYESHVFRFEAVGDNAVGDNIVVNSKSIAAD